MTDDVPGGERGPDVLGGRDTSTYRALMSNGRFRNLFWAMLTSSLGDWVGLFAILALTEDILGATRAGAFAVSGIMIARIVPTLVLGPVAGVFVDRWDRKRTLILTDIGRGVVMAAVALVGDVFQLLVATFVIEVLSTLFIPAKDATLPNLVDEDELVEANQLSLMVTYGTLPLGALAFAAFVGGSNTLFGDVAFLAERPVAVPIWLNAATFFVSAAFVGRIRFGAARHGRHGRHRRHEPHEHEAGAWQELREGFAFVATKPLIRSLVIGVMAAFLAAGVVIALGTYFATILNTGDTGFGVLGFVVGAGLFAGLVSAGWLSSRLALERLFAPGIGIAGGALIVTALMPRLDLAVLPALIMGAGAGLSFVTGYTLLQRHSDDEVRGRTFAAFNTGVRAALFASLVVGPFLLGLIGLERSQAAIDAGREETSVEELDTDAYYPYQIGGIRLTLMLAGLVAIGGAVWSGHSIHQVLVRRERDADEIVLDPAPVRRVGRGVFLAFEGGEGAGKSTQIERLRQHLARHGYDIVVTREPGGTPLGERIRGLLLDPTSHVSDRAEALLFAAARAQHAEERIRPALARGAIVLCDRYIDSSVVYQGAARGLGLEQVERLSRWATGELLPDRVLLLDVPPELGMSRAGTRPDRLEQAGLSFHQMVNETYRSLAADHPERYSVIDATATPDAVQSQLRAIVEDLLDEQHAAIAEEHPS